MLSSRTWYVSPITRRILVVNVGALVILVMGLLYTGQYEREMIVSELNALQAEGRLLAAALAEGGVREKLNGDPVLADDLSREMLRRLVESSTLRTILFGKNGQLMLDSHQLMGPGGLVQISELETPFETWDFGRKFSYYLQKILDLFPTRLMLPVYPEKAQGMEDYPHLSQTFRGDSSSTAWRDEHGRILLVTALPVQKLKNVLGAVILTRPGINIEQAAHEIQLTFIRIFLWVLLATILISVYLSRTIVSPILQLAAAAGKVRESLLLKDSIPDFSSRKDEIGVLSTALREMADALAERLDAIGNFAADVAHEIRNPLASLNSAVETLAIITDPLRQKKLLAIIGDDVSRLNRLVTDISMASRLDSELHRMKKTSLDFASLLQDIVSIAAANPDLHGRISLSLETHKKLLVTGNDVQLGRVINNLLENAVSFLSADGKITVFCVSHGDKIFACVDNNGPPIPEKNLEAIFGRFYSERPESEKFGLHSGLGLSISRQIIHAHHGTVFARNLKNGKDQHQGVRFTIILPKEG